MNNRGSGTGLALILLLAVALIVALLAARQFTTVNPDSHESQTQAQAVEQAQDLVNQLNGRMDQYD